MSLLTRLYQVKDFHFIYMPNKGVVSWLCYQVAEVQLENSKPKNDIIVTAYKNMFENTYMHAMSNAGSLYLQGVSALFRRLIIPNRPLGALFRKSLLLKYELVLLRNEG